jgi:hypothetical protein
MVAGWNPFFFFKSTGFTSSTFSNPNNLFTNPTGRHYTKHRFSPDIASNASKKSVSWEGGHHHHHHDHMTRGSSSRIVLVLYAEYGSWEIVPFLPLILMSSLNNKCKCSVCVLWFACVCASWKPTRPLAIPMKAGLSLSLPLSFSHQAPRPRSGGAEPHARLTTASPVTCLRGWLGLRP